MEWAGKFDVAAHISINRVVETDGLDINMSAAVPLQRLSLPKWTSGEISARQHFKLFTPPKKMLAKLTCWSTN